MGQASFSYHLVHVRRRLPLTALQKSSQLKLLGQFYNHHKGSTCTLFVSDAACQPTWPPWQKIEPRGKYSFWLLSLKLKASKVNLTWDQNVYQVEIVVP